MRNKKCNLYLLSAMLILLLAPAASAEENELTFVLGTDENYQSLMNASVTSPVNISIYTYEDVPDLSNKSVFFLASLNDSALSSLTVNNSAVICGYNLTNTSLINTEADNNLIKYWVYGGDSNIADMTAYMDYHFLDNSSRSYDLPVPPANRINMTFVVGGTGLKPGLLLANDDPLISKYVRVNVVETSDQMPTSLVTEDIVLLRMLGNDWAQEMGPLAGDAMDQNNATVVSVDSPALGSDFGTVNESSPEYSDIVEYITYKGDENLRRLVIYLAATYKDAPLETLPVEPRPLRGLYHPDAPKVFDTTEEYLEWYNSTGRYNPANITIGIIQYAIPSDPDASRVEDALFREYESRGCNVIFGTVHKTDTYETATSYFVQDDTCIVDSIVALKAIRLWSRDTEMMVEHLENLNVPVLRGIGSYYSTQDEWENSSMGISAKDTAYNIGLPEFDGVFDPIILSWKESGKFVDPLEEHLDWMISRSINHAQLGEIPESEKKVAILYYNHGGGKNNFQAMYLDVPESLGNLVTAMNISGYNTGDNPIPNETELIDLMIRQGRNIGTWAPGELENMVATGDVVLWPQEEYMTWFSELPAENQEGVIDQWGPAPGEIMVYANESGSYFVIPRIEFGNVVLGPQPTRGWSQDDAALYHNKELVPHHQYIAYYFWLQHEYEADAIVHFGTHGTQEWLPGKQVTLSRYDWPAVMVGDVPVIYPYIMDDVGEGIQAKRRGNALIVDHLTSPIIEAGLYGDFVELSDHITQYNDVSFGGELKDEYKNAIIQEYTELDLVDALAVTPEYLNSTNETQFDLFLEDFLEPYIDGIKTASMPYGMHVMGEHPPKEQTVGMVRLMLGNEYIDTVEAINDSGNASVRLLEEVLLNGTSITDSQIQILGTTDADVTAYLDNGTVYYQNIQDCTQEIPNIQRALNGEYIKPGSGNDPIRSPDSLPTGINFYSLDYRLVPDEVTYGYGVMIANQTLEMYMEDHNGTYPEKVAFVTFSTELIRHRGVTESEILYLLGIKPKWNPKNGRIYIDDTCVIPEEELGRPRIDILLTSSGLYRDMYPEQLMMIDEAVRLAANAPNSTYPNYVKEHSQDIYDQLIALGYNETDAKRLSESRVVSRQPGVYGTGLEEAIGASNTWDDESKLAELYMNNLGNFYGEDMWGENNIDLFKMMLDGVDVTVQSDSSNQLGLLDNDDFPAWNGGLALAVREVSGYTPETYINNLIDPNNMGVETLSEVLNREMYARYFNPTWIEGMMGAGTSGAQEMDRFVEFLWMWEATVPDTVSDANWDRIYDVYVNDKYDLGLDEFLQTENPYSYQSMTSRMLETARKEHWDASDEVIQNLVKEYVESIVKDGVTCCHHSCGNPLLDEYVQGVMSTPGVVSKETAEEYNRLMQEATHRSTPQQSSKKSSSHSSSSSSSSSAKIIDSTVSQSGNQTIESDAGYGTSAEQAPKPSSSESASDYVEGYEMTKESVEKESGGMSFSGADIVGTLLILISMGAIYFGFMKKRI